LFGNVVLLGFWDYIAGFGLDEGILLVELNVMLGYVLFCLAVEFG
jgi:hypothetical protein